MTSKSVRNIVLLILLVSMFGCKDNVVSSKVNSNDTTNNGSGV